MTSSVAGGRDGVCETLDIITAAARRLRIQEFEAYVVLKKTKRVIVEMNRVAGADAVDSKCVHLRVASDKRVGSAFCTALDQGSIEKCMTEASDIARLRQPDPRWTGFASTDRDYPSIAGLNDKSIASIDFESMAMMAEELLNGALSVSKDISVTYGGIEAMQRAIGVANSSGLHASMDETGLQAGCSCVSGEGLSVTPDCADVGRSRSCDIPFTKTGERCGRIASLSANQVEAKTEECDVVMSPSSIGDEGSGLISLILSKALSGQNVSHKISFLSDLVDAQVGSDRLSITDNPILAARYGSRPFDDEGVPSSKKELVRKGVLKRFVWDHYHGSSSGTGSTGNAVRDLTSGAMTAAPLCLQLSPGKGSMDSVISQVDHGYLVWACQGAHTANTETGDYSFVASPGLKIERGEIVGGVRGVMMSGNLLDLLKSVDILGSDVTDFGCSLMPTTLFRDVKITTG